MTIVFPPSPNTNDTFSPGPNLPTWVWDGSKWIAPVPDPGGGGGGDPGPPNTSIQFNSNGAFAGSPYLTWDGSALKLAGHISLILADDSVSALPAASSNYIGARTTVSDAQSRFGVVTGGGSNIIPIHCDGTNWRSDIGDAPPAPPLIIPGIENAPFLPLAGGILDGDLTLNGNPTAPLHAATRQYVDDALAAGSGVTSIIAGTGLSGGTITATGTIALVTPVSVANGGTGSTTAAAAEENLGGPFLKLTGGTLTGLLTGTRINLVNSDTGQYGVNIKGRGIYLDVGNTATYGLDINHGNNVSQTGPNIYLRGANATNPVFEVWRWNPDTSRRMWINADGSTAINYNGTASALDINNSGTGNSLLVRNGATNYFTIASDGMLQLRRGIEISHGFNFLNYPAISINRMQATAGGTGIHIYSNYTSESAIIVDASQSTGNAVWLSGTPKDVGTLLLLDKSGPATAFRINCYGTSGNIGGPGMVITNSGIGANTIALDIENNAEGASLRIREGGHERIVVQQSGAMTMTRPDSSTCLTMNISGSSGARGLYINAMNAGFAGPALEVSAVAGMIASFRNGATTHFSITSAGDVFMTPAFRTAMRTALGIT